MKTIQLTQGQVALVDDEDYEYLNQWKWQALKHYNYFYAVSSVYDSATKKQKHFKMHRIILNLSDPKILCDHKDGNKLNNQKNNLRVATASQNMSNRKSKKNGTSIYLGVSYIKRDKKWQASIKHEGKTTNLGLKKNEIEAAKLYDEAAKRLHKEFANLNFK